MKHQDLLLLNSEGKILMKISNIDCISLNKNSYEIKDKNDKYILRFQKGENMLLILTDTIKDRGNYIGILEYE